MRFSEELAKKLKACIHKGLGKGYTVIVHVAYDISNDAHRMSISADAPDGINGAGMTLSDERKQYNIFTEEELIIAIVRHMKKSFGIEDKKDKVA